jgi:hypothetical protein
MSKAIVAEAAWKVPLLRLRALQGRLPARADSVTDTVTDTVPGIPAEAVAGHGVEWAQRLPLAVGRSDVPEAEHTV